MLGASPLALVGGRFFARFEVGKLDPIDVPATVEKEQGDGWWRARWSKELWIPAPLPTSHRQCRVSLWANLAIGPVRLGVCGVPGTLDKLAQGPVKNAIVQFFGSVL